MNRRELVFQGASTLAVGMSLASSASAAGKKAALSKSSLEKIAGSSDRCVSTGMTCISHCEKEISQGNKAMEECLKSVLDLVTVCESLHKLASRESPYTKEFAKATAKVCGDCAKLCEKHANHMEVCKACMEACRECEKVCMAA